MKRRSYLHRRGADITEEIAAKDELEQESLKETPG